MSSFKEIENLHFDNLQSCRGLLFHEHSNMTMLMSKCTDIGFKGL